MMGHYHDEGMVPRPEMDVNQTLRLLEARIKRLEQNSDDFEARVRYIMAQIEVERARTEGDLDDG